MVRGGSLGRGTILALVVVAVLVPIGRSGASPAKTNSLNAMTVDVSLPGPFNGCTFLDPGATPTSDAINDLIVPSAFLTTSAGNLYGENGPIASAELTSLTPETVKYTIAPNEKWSNGTAFNGNDLEGWWLRARALRTVLSDGYRDITSLTVSKDGYGVTAVFATPYADWNLLFRDVEALGTQGNCSLSSLLARPSLGPYSVTSATASRVVLTMNRHWPVDTDRFGRIVITDAGVIPASPGAHFVNFSLVVNRSLVQAISAHPNVMSHIGSSSNIEEIAFASSRPLIKRIAVREALSWSIGRQALIDQLWGAVTFSPSVAASALYSQGQSNYPGPAGTSPSAQTTTTTIAPSSAQNGLGDCLLCALDVLSQSGFVRSATGWTTASGTPLNLTMAVGPSALDETVAASIVHEWASIGIKVKEVNVRSDVAAAVATSTNTDDLAIFTRPTVTAVSYAARSWSGPGYADAYPSGWRTTTVTNLFNQAIANFNPVTASTTWLQMDQTIQSSYWARPLFTSPSLLAWTNTLTGVTTSFSVPGLLDQVPIWSVAPPSTQG
ncbi:MAG TPA: ABC transporter substrate-binding protein [Acidimicrobiales bacterium]|nr:ABC transporter substrate-binding protein [Acidimicrobiales bacterium]